MILSILPRAKSLRNWTAIPGHPMTLPLHLLHRLGLSLSGLGHRLGLVQYLGHRLDQQHRALSTTNEIGGLAGCSGRPLGF